MQQLLHLLADELVVVCQPDDCIPVEPNCMHVNVGARKALQALVHAQAASVEHINFYIAWTLLCAERCVCMSYRMHTCMLRSMADAQHVVLYGPSGHVLRLFGVFVVHVQASQQLEALCVDM
jgi:hypothetical protein